MPFIIEKERDPLYKDGLEKGLEKGMEKVSETKNAIAKALLKKQIDIEVIAESTGLSKEEINTIRDELS